MRILVSAYACEPGKGSEPGVGWNFLQELSKRDGLEIWAITRANNRTCIECGAAWTERIHWIWFDIPRTWTFWKKGSRGVQLYYFLWQHGIYRFIRKQIANGQLPVFDHIYHITFGNYWMPSFLGKLNIPFTFGPVGGGEQTPPGWNNCYSPSGKRKELIKKAAIRLFRYFPGTRSAYHSMTHVLAATEQTRNAILPFVNCPVTVVPQSGLSNEDLQHMRKIALETHRPCHPVFITACRLEHWKAVNLAIDAFALFHKRHPDAVLEILGKGPERPRLESQVARLGLADCVHFLNRLPSLDDVYRKIASATALLHPALHEAFGQVCLESLALGTPVICWDWGGPSLIARHTGLAVPVEKNNPSTSVAQFSMAMENVLSFHSKGNLWNPQFEWKNVVKAILEN